MFTCDVGTPTIWLARYIKMNGKRRHRGVIRPWFDGECMMQAIGAQASFPKRQIVSLSGDGGFTMMMGDFLTLVQQKLPVKVIVFNNGVLGFVAMEMKASGFLESGVSLENPRFRGHGAGGRRAWRAGRGSGGARGGRAEVLAHDGPALLDAVTAPQELSMPPRIGLEQAKGFSLWALRAIINGREDELIEVARTNLLR